MIYASTANTPARLGIGSSGQVLGVSSGIPAWTAAPSSALTLSTIASGNFTAGTTFSLSGLSSYDTLILRLSEVQFSTGHTAFWAYINNDTTAVYDYTGGYKTLDSTGGNHYSPVGDTQISLTSGQSSADNYSGNVTITFTNCKSSGFTNFNVVSACYNNNIFKNMSWSSGTINLAAAVSSIYLGAVYAFKNTVAYKLIGG
jgi:hypothetical protein